ncbi:MAG: sugar phosphate nucleotidyltransferase [Rikenellaceae bacterium]
MTTKPTLLILAAGMGSRYGSLKQMDGVGPYKETIIDYTIYDAIRAGFGKVVFVIRGVFEAEFREMFSAERFNNQIEVDFVLQELDRLPEGYAVPEGREKPWGTAHAVMVAKDAINEPFAVVNADDFYGQNAIEVMGAYLAKLVGKKASYAMMGYELRKTLSENGTVSRGVCQVGRCSQLASMVERTKIERQDGDVVYLDDEGSHPLDENTPVSMNLFGFTPDFFDYAEGMFKDFLATKATVDSKAEFFIPLVVNQMLETKAAKMKVLKTTSDWFGVTYIEDRPATTERIKALVEGGVYAGPLWGEK